MEAGRCLEAPKARSAPLTVDGIMLQCMSPVLADFVAEVGALCKSAALGSKLTC